MSKELEALCYLDDIAHGRKMSLDPHELKLIIEKSLKALEIIRKREINMPLFLLYLRNGNNRGTYNSCWKYSTDHRLTREEYELLKEVLK